MKPRVLFVDDEAHILQAYRRTLRREFDVGTALGGTAAIERLGADGPYAVIVSDMRMPEMDGIQFLVHARAAAPDSVRMMLTGNADVQTATDAVNEGYIFRFLTKPCPPETLARALHAGCRQHQLITAERELLEQTLAGSIRTLTDVLSLVEPEAFGRATRVKRTVAELAEDAAIEDRWQAEVAALLSQLGCVTLPPDVARKLYYGRPLDDEERKMVARLPEVSARLLSNIPRLDGVIAILHYQNKQFDGSGEPRDRVSGRDIPWGARALRLALDLDALEANGLPTQTALDTLRGRTGHYDAELLDLLAKRRGCGAAEHEIREIGLADLRVGMVLEVELVSQAGVLLVARGNEVTESLVSRLCNLAQRVGVKEPIRVRLNKAAEARSVSAVAAG